MATEEANTNENRNDEERRGTAGEQSQAGASHPVEGQGDAQHQANSSHDSGGVTAAPSSSHVPEPQFGQRTLPEYGALRSQYPGWNPYIYGQPEPEEPKPESQNAHSSAIAFGRHPQASGSSDAARSGQTQSDARGNVPMENPSGMNPAGGQPRMTGGKGQPRFLGGVNLDDPNQNPVYGRWDPYAVISFIMSLFLALPILPLIMGVIAIYRTTVFHMKGRALAIAAVVIAVIELILMAVMVYYGISNEDVVSMLERWLSANAGSGTSFSA